MLWWTSLRVYSIYVLINQIIFNGNKLTASILVHSIFDGIKVGLKDIEYLLFKKKNQIWKEKWHQ